MKIKIYDAIGWFLSIMFLIVGGFCAYSDKLLWAYLAFILGFIGIIIGTSEGEK